MRKFLKIVGISLAGLVLVAVIGISLFIYKARYGFNFYETTPPELPASLNKNGVLIFSKTNGFRHGGAIEASLPVFQQMAEENSWPIFITDNGAVFNSEQLSRFGVVVWNNTSGKVLNDEQRQAFRTYLEGGGGFVGIHAAGDNSHQWEWYEQEVIGAEFSHHPLDPQIQKSILYLEPDQADHELASDLPGRWEQEEEWYVFSTNPRDSDANVLYTLDESLINPSGNIGFLVTDKDWGMGDDHPIVWYRTVGQGRAFYSALGHQAAAFEEPFHIEMLENALRWAGNLP